MRSLVPLLLLPLLLSACADAGQPSPFCDTTRPPPVPPYCTRTLGQVECWANPAALPGPPRELADGPRSLTAAQQADCARLWPRW